MQRMKTNAASIGVENWIGKNVVQIYHHRCQHQKIGMFPIIFEENFRNDNRKNQMQKIVDEFSKVKKVVYHLELI